MSLRGSLPLGFGQGAPSQLNAISFYDWSHADNAYINHRTPQDSTHILNGTSHMLACTSASDCVPTIFYSCTACAKHIPHA